MKKSLKYKICLLKNKQFYFRKSDKLVLSFLFNARYNVWPHIIRIV